MKYPWSNGQLEGQVNRLKTIKRQMYGRANFDLLRARVLHRSPALREPVSSKVAMTLTEGSHLIKLTASQLPHAHLNTKEASEGFFRWSVR